jgi:hypothetical protein
MNLLFFPPTISTKIACTLRSNMFSPVDTVLQKITKNIVTWSLQPLKATALRCFKMPGKCNPVTQHQIPDDLSAEQYHCGNHKSCLMDFVCFYGAATMKTAITNSVPVIAISTYRNHVHFHLLHTFNTFYLPHQKKRIFS